MKAKTLKFAKELLLILVALALAVTSLFVPMLERIAGIGALIFSIIVLVFYTLALLRPTMKQYLPPVLRGYKGLVAILFILLVSVAMTLNLFSAYTLHVYKAMIS